MLPQKTLCFDIHCHLWVLSSFFGAVTKIRCGDMTLLPMEVSLCLYVSVFSNVGNMAVTANSSLIHLMLYPSMDQCKLTLMLFVLACVLFVCFNDWNGLH